MKNHAGGLLAPGNHGWPGLQRGRRPYLCLEADPKVFEEGRPGGRWCLNDRWRAWKVRIDQGGELVPYAEVILDLVMRLVQGPRVPTIVVAIYGTVFIGHMNVSHNLRLRRIDRYNLRCPMKRTFALVEIDRASYVWWDRRGLVTWFSNSVDLDGEGHGNTQLL